MCDCRRFGVDVPGALVPSADMEGIAAGGTTIPLVAGFGFGISLIRGPTTRDVFMGRASAEVFSWSMSQHLIVKLSKPRSVFSIR